MAGDGRDRDQKSATDDSGSTDDSGKPIDVRRWRPGRRTVLVAGVVGLAGVGAGTVYMSDDDPDRRTAEPGDAANLNELLDDAEAGDEVVAEEGEYVGQVGITTDELTLRGRGEGTVIRGESGDVAQQQLGVAADGVTVEDLAVVGNREADLSEWEFGELAQADGVGVYGDECLVRRVTARCSQSHGIIVWGRGASEVAAVSTPAGKRYDNVVRDCHIEDTGHPDNVRAALDVANGFDPESDDPWARTPHDTRLLDCTIVGGEFSRTHITLHGARRTTVRGHELGGRLAPDSTTMIAPHTDNAGAWFTGMTVRREGFENGEVPEEFIRFGDCPGSKLTDIDVEGVPTPVVVVDGNPHVSGSNNRFANFERGLVVDHDGRAAIEYTT